MPRAAAFEPRLAAAVADPGVDRIWTSWFDNFPQIIDLFETGDKQPFDAVDSGRHGRVPATASRFDLAKRSEPFPHRSIFDLLTAVKATTSPASPATSAARPWSRPRGEQFWPGHRGSYSTRSPARRPLIRFTAAEGADLHCEPLAPGLRNQRVFDWLDATLRPEAYSSATGGEPARLH